jgi:hypothetical protein
MKLGIAVKMLDSQLITEEVKRIIASAIICLSCLLSLARLRAASKILWRSEANELF